MNQTITNPNKVNHKIYIILIVSSLVTLVASFYIPLEINGVLSYAGEIVKNLSYGCIASTLVAWIIDCANTRHLNRKANNIYDAVYGDLKFCIGSFIGTWATLCAVSFKDKDYHSEKLTWNAWYNTVKDKYSESDPELQQSLLEFYYSQLSQATRDVNDSIKHLYSQRYMLTMNDVMNDEIERILSDFQFEFHVLELELARKDKQEKFWENMDAINADLNRYISNWKDIKHYNYLVFQPHKFSQDKKDLLIAVIQSVRSDSSKAD